MKFILRVRHIKWFFRKAWYAFRHDEFLGDHYFLLDIGAITIGFSVLS